MFDPIRNFGPASCESGASTCGDSIGYTSASESVVFEDAGECSTTVVGRGTVLLNGLQLINCPLPENGKHSTVRVQALGSTDTLGTCGGAILDLLFTATGGVPPAEGHEFQAQLMVESECGCKNIKLGAIRTLGENVHISRYTKGAPQWFTLTVSHIPVLPTTVPAEEQFVAEIREALDDPITNKHRGSVSQVILNNRAKSSPLYAEVVGKLYNGMWLEFLMSHSNDFSLFRYSPQEIRDLGLSPHIKRSDVRVCSAARDASTISEADQRAEAERKSAEESTRLAVKMELSAGEVTQGQLLQRLKGHKGFASTLYPTLTLLLRFLGRHKDTFIWTSSPDQPTSIGLRGSRPARHEAPTSFAERDHTPKVTQGSPPCAVLPSPVQAYRHDPYSADSPLAYLTC
eukprot:TRINITY_DN22424_c0_g1_i1.p1 TRINITY_DN22424_c0_g1~~TRINITY_DN22424_c0_g1_i1.p1  ORF type:complete len:402 (+),score=37.00 TRINITY_DN22424_c0_g1_i1:65-1270(+)